MEQTSVTLSYLQGRNDTEKTTVMFDVMKGINVALRHNQQMLLTFPTALPVFFSPASYFAPETLGDINKQGCNGDEQLHFHCDGSRDLNTDLCAGATVDNRNLGEEGKV